MRKQYVCNSCGSTNMVVEDTEFEYIVECDDCGSRSVTLEDDDYFVELKKEQKPLQRLVVIVNKTDDCTYSFDETYPILYESAEAFLCDFEDAWNLVKNEYNADKRNDVYFDIAGKKMGCLGSFTYRKW